jgi:uncharacterized protein YkwD
MKQDINQIIRQVRDSLAPTYQALREALPISTPPVSVSRLEAHLANQVNAAREQMGLPRLTFDRQLAAVSRAHSAEMCGLDYFEHESPTPGLQRPSDRYQAGFGQRASYISENIAQSVGSEWRSLSLERAEKAHNGLMDSPGHRANILAATPTRMGIGIVANANGDLWITQMFSRP